MLLIHGARAVLAGTKPERCDRRCAGALTLQTLRGHNKATVALANKLVRIAWAVWRSDLVFKATPAA